MTDAPQDPRLAEASHILRQALKKNAAAEQLLQRSIENMDRNRQLRNEIVFYLFISVALVCAAMFWELGQ